MSQRLSGTGITATNIVERVIFGALMGAFPGR